MLLVMVKPIATGISQTSQRVVAICASMEALPSPNQRAKTRKVGNTYGSGVYKDLQKRCYWNYWRVYQPIWTRLHAANQTPVPGQWLLNGQDWDGRATIQTGIKNTQLISGLFVLPTNQTQDIILQFMLPPHVITQMSHHALKHQLKIQKQAGLLTLPINIQVKPPHHYDLRNADRHWQFDQNTGFWIWDGKITKTKTFDLLFVSTDSAEP